jgi:hypothetical protein
MTIEYKPRTTLLSRLSQKYGSDKGAPLGAKSPFAWDYHTYTDVYTLMFDHCRDSVKNVFELGLGTNNLDVPSSMGLVGKPGASLYMWREYFYNADIYGADIDERILFSDDDILTYYVDQTSGSSIEAMWSRIDTDFDLIIDDGLHDYNANITFFEHSKHRVRSGGVYIIEDIAYANIERFREYFSDYNADFLVLHRPNIAIQSNCLGIIHL